MECHKAMQFRRLVDQRDSRPRFRAKKAGVLIDAITWIIGIVAAHRFRDVKGFSLNPPHIPTGLRIVRSCGRSKPAPSSNATCCVTRSWGQWNWSFPSALPTRQSPIQPLISEEVKISTVTPTLVSPSSLQVTCVVPVGPTANFLLPAGRKIPNWLLKVCGNTSKEAGEYLKEFITRHREQLS
jgi:hypothetical protein